jgi:hypothetical protein
MVADARREGVNEGGRKGGNVQEGGRKGSLGGVGGGGMGLGVGRGSGSGSGVGNSGGAGGNGSGSGGGAAIAMARTGSSGAQAPRAGSVMQRAAERLGLGLERSAGAGERNYGMFGRK